MPATVCSAPSSAMSAQPSTQPSVSVHKAHIREAAQAQILDAAEAVFARAGFAGSTMAAIAEAAPELVLGTQMERHIAKRHGIPCAVISAPVHVQDFPARYAPQMGFEGANVLFDTWVHPLMMGLEEHLLGMFREDFEFHDGAAPSHLGSGHSASINSLLPELPTPGALQIHLTTQADQETSSPTATTDWAPEAEQELKKIPFFVRGKARRNTELFARERGVSRITVETMYEAKAHFSR